MKFDDVYLVSDKLETSSEAELKDLEAKLGMALPKGYAEYMLHLGVGTYCDELCVYSPEKILDDYEYRQEQWDDYFFWDEGADVLTKEQVLQCVVFAYTPDGDEIIAHPDLPECLFVLPRHDMVIYKIPGCFDAPLAWVGPEGEVRREPKFRYFESWKDRAYKELFTAKELFSIKDLAPYFVDFWEQMGKKAFVLTARKDIEDEEEEDEEPILAAMVYVRGIGGSVQLTQAYGDKRVGIRIDYDTDFEGDVAPFVEFLTDMGFYQTDSGSED